MPNAKHNGLTIMLADITEEGFRVAGTDRNPKGRNRRRIRDGMGTAGVTERGRPSTS
jgi:hypothetical protein